MVKFKRYLFSEIPIPRTTAYRYKRRKRSPLRDTKQEEDQTAGIQCTYEMNTDLPLCPDNNLSVSTERNLFLSNEADLEDSEADDVIESSIICHENLRQTQSDLEQSLCTEPSSITFTFEDDFWNERNVKKDTLCPCTKSTADDVMLMCLTLGLRHNLTWVAQEDILHMINSIYGDERVPQSKHKYFSLIDRSQGKFKYHIYCSECDRYIGDKDDLSENIQCKCGSTFQLSTSDFFLSVSLESQFKELFQDERLVKYLLTYRFRREKTNITALEDIYDGAEYKKHLMDGGILSYPYNFSYSFSTDGVPMGKSCGKTIWPIYISINEFPPEERCKYILLAGLYVGQKDPKQNVFLQPFVEQANKLSNEGFSWQHNGIDVVSKVIPLCAVVDSVARWQLLSMSAVNSYYACTFCYQKAEHTVKGQRFPPRSHKADDRTAESTRNDMERAFEIRHENGKKKKTVKGVKGPTALLKLMYFNLIAGFVPDYMHCLLLGVVRLHTELILESTRKKFWIGMENAEIGCSHLISAIDERLTKICSLSSITRSVRPISQMSLWKASEWRSWLVFYSVPCLKGLLKSKHLLHISLLSKATNLLLQRSISIEEVNEAHKLFLRYIFLFNKYFGVTAMVLNVHLISHIAQGVINWGPLWTHNAFVYEGQNRHLLQLVQSPGHVLKQVARKFLIYSNLPSLCNELATSKSVIEFCGNRLNRKLQHYIRCESILLLGKRERCDLSDEENNCLIEKGISPEDCFSFKRLLLKGSKYCISDYVRDKKHDDSYIAVTDQMFAHIKKIVNVNKTEVFLLVQEVMVAREPLVVDHFFALNHVKRVTGYGQHYCVLPKDIDCQCVCMNIASDKFICKMPFGCLGD